MPFRSAKRLLRRGAARLRRWLCWLTGGSWKRALAAVALMAALAGVGGFALVSLGLVSISASSGHWKATGWLLHYAMRRAVSTQSMGIEAPPLDDPALVLQGAGHYETGCASCHGAPGRERPLIAQRMTPAPPPLPPRIEQWAPQELFWIVKHGIKYTAMPAWPAANRDDEVWAMVAFLQALPAMTEQRYRELALGVRAEDRESASAGRPGSSKSTLDRVLDDCSRCHGADGSGRGASAVPRLAGQREAYLLGTLQAYASGTRHSGIMQPVAAGLDPQMLNELAKHYAGLSMDTLVDFVASPEVLARGKELAERGMPARGIPSCVHCHGPKRSPRNPMYPDIAGQHARYLKQQLELFSAGTRGGSEYLHVMHSAAQRLKPEQMQALADYYAALPTTDESTSVAEQAAAQPQR